MILVSHATGNQNVRALLRAFEANGLLQSFHTTLGWSEVPFARALPAGIRAQLERRVYAAIPGRKIHSSPLRELARLAAPCLGLSRLTEHETGWASVDSVYRALDRDVARIVARGSDGLRGVYAYEDSALETLTAAQVRGIRRFYELPIGYWRAARELFVAERELQPEWAATLEALSDSPEKLARKDEELRRAQHVVVPSSFVRETLRLHPGFAAQVHIAPYGAPPPRPFGQCERRSGPLRALFVGRLSQRKGLSYLFSALGMLSGVTLTVVGAKPSAPCRALERALGSHRWIGPVPHARVMEIMSEHDVLVFPSLFEGQALVVLEAMSQGLPVITTQNSGAGDIVTDGEDGFIVPIRDARALASQLELLAADRARLCAMSEAASRKAGALSWEGYGARIAGLAKSWLSSAEPESSIRST